MAAPREFTVLITTRTGNEHQVTMRADNRDHAIRRAAIRHPEVNPADVIRATAYAWEN